MRIRLKVLATLKPKLIGMQKRGIGITIAADLA